MKKNLQREPGPKKNSNNVNFSLYGIIVWLPKNTLGCCTIITSKISSLPISEILHPKGCSIGLAAKMQFFPILAHCMQHLSKK